MLHVNGRTIYVMRLVSVGREAAAYSPSPAGTVAADESYYGGTTVTGGEVGVPGWNATCELLGNPALFQIMLLVSVLHTLAVIARKGRG